MILNDETTPERPQTTPDHTRSSQNHSFGTDLSVPRQTLFHLGLQIHSSFVTGICLHTSIFTSYKRTSNWRWHWKQSVKLYLNKTVRQTNWKQIISLYLGMIMIETTTHFNIAQYNTIQYSNFTEKIQFSKCICILK